MGEDRAAQVLGLHHGTLGHSDDVKNAFVAGFAKPSFDEKCLMMRAALTSASAAIDRNEERNPCVPNRAIAAVRIRSRVSGGSSGERMFIE